MRHEDVSVCKCRIRCIPVDSSCLTAVIFSFANFLSFSIIFGSGRKSFVRLFNI